MQVSWRKDGEQREENLQQRRPLGFGTKHASCVRGRAAEKPRSRKSPLRRVPERATALLLLWLLLLGPPKESPRLLWLLCRCVSEDTSGLLLRLHRGRRRPKEPAG